MSDYDEEPPPLARDYSSDSCEGAEGFDDEMPQLVAISAEDDYDEDEYDYSDEYSDDSDGGSYIPPLLDEESDDDEELPPLMSRPVEISQGNEPNQSANSQQQGYLPNAHQNGRPAVYHQHIILSVSQQPDGTFAPAFPVGGEPPMDFDGLFGGGGMRLSPFFQVFQVPTHLSMLPREVHAYLPSFVECTSCESFPI